MQQPPTTYTVNGRKVRELRKEAGLEVAELAERAGISRRFLSHIENGTRPRMRPTRFQRLRNALGANASDLLAPPESSPPEGDPLVQRQVPPIRPPHAAG